MAREFGQRGFELGQRGFEFGQRDFEHGQHSANSGNGLANTGNALASGLERDYGLAGDFFGAADDADLVAILRNRPSGGCTTVAVMPWASRKAR